MKWNFRQKTFITLLGIWLFCVATVATNAQSDPLPSWNDGANKRAIVDFVSRVTKEDGPEFIPAAERIAVFDNDGTLWCEIPVPVQAFFVNDRLKALAPLHPEWQRTEPFKSMLAGDIKTAMATGLKGLADLAMATHAGMTTDEFVGLFRIMLERSGVAERIGQENIFHTVHAGAAKCRDNGSRRSAMNVVHPS